MIACNNNNTMHPLPVSITRLVAYNIQSLFSLSFLQKILQKFCIYVPIHVNVILMSSATRIYIVGVKTMETVLDNGQSEVRNERPVLWTAGVH